MRVIYWDVVFTVNFVMNVVILYLTGYFTRNMVSIWRIIAGSAIGSIYLLAFLFPDLRIFYTVLMKFLLSILIIVVTFFPPKLKEFLRIIGYFYLISFMIGGSAFAIFYLTDIGDFYNGVLLIKDINIPWWILILSVVVVYFSIKYTWEFLQNRFWKEKAYIPLTIFVENQLFKLNALVDTGNDLHDPISDVPVIIVEYNAIKKALSEEIQEIFNKGKENDLSELAKGLANSEMGNRFRVIPFSSIGKTNGLLVGFRPDKINLELEERTIEIMNSIIGIYNTTLSPEGRYSALLHPELLKG